MIGNQGKIVLNQLERALTAEEKQGCSNTGAMGGFHNFLKGIVRRLEQLLPEQDFSLLSSFAQQYSNWSPLQRRQALVHLKNFINTLATTNVLNTKVENISSQNDSFENNEIKQQFKELEQPSVRISKNEAEIESTSKALKQTASSESLQYLKGVGPERYKLLKQLGITNVKELLLYYPRRYEDRHLQNISQLKDGELASVTGKVVASQITYGKIKVVKLSIEQEGRLLFGIWFNQAFIAKQYPEGTSVIVTGKVQWNRRVPEILATDIQKVGSGDYDEILPVYSETGKLSSKVIRSLVKRVITKVPEVFVEVLPKEVMADWMQRPLAYQEIHFPKSFSSLAKARERLVFEEVLFLQLAVARLRQGVKKEDSPSLTGGEELIERFFQSLPFDLTSAQNRVIREIFHDMSQKKGMARLVQGDVGSGKTAVAMAALVKAVGSGYQGALMAPTEILALQHFQSLEEAFKPLGIHVVLLLGSQTKSERAKILEEIRKGSAHIVVGTQALIQDTVQFYSLGLAVTDEQHRFGVKQRTSLQSKGESPHVLVLTATPIPRTLALTLYGDLQLSVLDEMPKGRKPIITRRLSERGRGKLEKFMEEQIDQGRQIYVVCPLVEESETLDLISATERYEALRQSFPHRNVALLHGRMKGSDKEEIMKRFQEGQIQILVSTTVVEVGVNVPNASIMVIEGAERFGLAQLHQLRGRVGRGSAQSYCFLVSDTKDSRRLDVLCETQDGFKIAEEDLRIRGAGELLGTRQHGVMELRLADLSRDGRIVEEAYRGAQKILQSPEAYPQLWKEVDQYFSLENVGVH